MIHEIITSEKKLSGISTVIPDDDLREEVLQLIIDLRDTAQENRPRCLGLAANQIGVNLRAFVVISKDGFGFNAFINPKVIAKSPQISSAPESCMSRLDKPPIRTRRAKWIKLEYTDPDTWERHTHKFKDLEARIIQHELDHLKGLLI